jgi:hypothetical protein
VVFMGERFDADGSLKASADMTRNQSVLMSGHCMTVTRLNCS